MAEMASDMEMDSELEVAHSLACCHVDADWCPWTVMSCGLQTSVLPLVLSGHIVLPCLHQAGLQIASAAGIKDGWKNAWELQACRLLACHVCKADRLTEALASSCAQLAGRDLQLAHTPDGLEDCASC